MTAGATHGQSKKPATDDINSVVTLVCSRNLDSAIVVEPGPLPEKSERRQRFYPQFFVHQVPSQLRPHKLVVGQIVIKCFYHPVAIQVCVGIGRITTPHRIEATIVIFSISRHVEPDAPPAFPVLWGGE